MAKKVVNRKKEYYQKEKNEEIIRKKRINSIKVLVAKNKLSKALAETRQFLEEYPDNSFGLFQEASIIYLLGDIQQAKEKLQYIVDQNLESKYAALYKLGDIAYVEERFDDARNYYLENINTSPYNEFFSIIGLSKIELEYGNYEEARNLLYRYSDMTDPNILLQESIVLRKMHKYKEAYAILLNNDFTSNDDILRDYYVSKGCLEADLGMYDESIETLNSALAYSRNKIYYKVKAELAYAYYMSGDYDTAIDIAKDIVNSTDSKYAGKASMLLGQIYMKKYEFDKAFKYFDQSIKYRYYHDPRGYLYIADICMINRDYDNANKYLDMYYNTCKNKVYRNIVHLKRTIINVKQDDLNSCIDNIEKVNPKYLDGKHIEDYEASKTYINIKTNKKVIYSIYSVAQQVDYSVDRLIEHINKEHIHQQFSSKFNDDINLEELAMQIPDMLDNARLISNRYYEKYRLTYEGIGTVNGEQVNTIHVVTIPNSKKIITMFPVNDEVKHYKQEKAKVKQKSQIDKFYQKYGKKNEN